MTPYHQFVAELARLAHAGKRFPLGGFPKPGAPATAGRCAACPDLLASSRRRVHHRSARPEAPAGSGFPDRQRRGHQGSNKARQAARWEELRDACDYLDFELVETIPGGLEKVNAASRSADPAAWQASVAVIARILASHQPEVVFFPHDADWNSSHIGTHYLVADALALQPPGFTCRVAETEFWGAMARPT